jgi:thioredoxin-related protein
VNVRENGELAKKFQVGSYPALLFFAANRNPKEVYNLLNSKYFSQRFSKRVIPAAAHA